MLSLSELILPPPLACVTSHAISVADKSASDMAAAVLGVSSSTQQLGVRDVKLVSTLVPLSSLSTMVALTMQGGQCGKIGMRIHY